MRRVSDQAMRALRSRGDRTAAPWRRARIWATYHPGAVGLLDRLGLREQAPGRHRVTGARHGGEPEIRQHGVEPPPRMPCRVPPVARDLGPGSLAHVVGIDRGQHLARGPSGHRVPLQDQLGTGHCGDGAPDEPAMGPGGVPSGYVVEQAALDVGAPEVEALGDPLVEVAVHGGEQVDPIRVHGTVDHRDEVEVAHAGHVVTCGQRSRHPQVRHPAELRQTSTELADARRLARHVVTRTGLHSGMPSILPDLADARATHPDAHGVGASRGARERRPGTVSVRCGRSRGSGRRRASAPGHAAGERRLRSAAIPWR